MNPSEDVDRLTGLVWPATGLSWPERHAIAEFMLSQGVRLPRPTWRTEHPSLYRHDQWRGNLELSPEERQIVVDALNAAEPTV